MKLKSLILGSVAAAGLSTGAFAADLGVLTSLDVCDALGLSGLTISSDTNCLQITGGVSYEFNWGDFNGKYTGANFVENLAADKFNVIDDDFQGAVAGVNGTYMPTGVGAVLTSYAPGAVLPVGATIITPAVAPIAANGNANQDWNSKVETWLKFVGTADSDFGPAKAVIKLKSVRQTVVANEGPTTVGGDATTGNGAFDADEAYVSVGDTTVIMAGKKSSIANFGDDEPFNFLGLFNSEKVDKGVMFVKDNPKTGGHVIQITSDLGNGLVGALGLENLDGATAAAGTLVGVLSYAGEGFTAHVTGLAGGILDGNVETYAVHAGFTGTFDVIKVRAAGAYGSTAGVDYWNVLGSAQATFDMFTIAISGEAVSTAAAGTDYGVGGSIGATVTDGVSINLGGRYYNSNLSQDGYQVAAQLVAAVTETIKITGEIGVYGTNKPAVQQTDFYGAAELAWAPGGGFTSSLKGEAHQNGGYKITFKAAKSFE